MLATRFANRHKNADALRPRLLDRKLEKRIHSRILTVRKSNNGVTFPMRRATKIVAILQA